MILNLVVLDKRYCICRFENNAEIPNWVYLSDFYTITKTDDELSVVTIESDLLNNENPVSKGWRIIKVMGPLDFSLIGIIAHISETLKQEEISIFTISTYDTDYILVKQKDLDSAIKALKDKGHNITQKTRM